ncbi:somatostatin receptor type 5-like [Aplochiton taeniatus]
MAGDGPVWWNTTDLAKEAPLGNSSGPGTVEQVLVPVLDTMILVLGLGGHSLVLVILCGRRRRGARQGPQPPMGTMRGTDVLLLALSVADVLLLVTVPFHTAAIATQRWPFGDFLCRLVSFLGAACSSTSAFTLATLAVSRYLTVVHPPQAFRLLTPRRVAVAAALLWVPACALAAPQLAFRSVSSPPVAVAPDGLACFSFLSHQGQLAYGLCHFLLAFLLPLATIAVAYGAIYLFLCRSRREGRAPQVERYQRKVTQTSALLVLAFALCWLPSYGLTLVLLARGGSGATGSSPRYGPFSLFSRLMATSSTVANPILYVLVSQKFRQDLLRLLWRRGGTGAQGTTP